MYHFAASILFYDIAQLRFPPKAIWVQQVVSTVFPGAWLRKIRQCFFAFSPVISTIFLVCSIGMYVDGICVINVFIYSWNHSPIFTSFAQQIRRPLCVHHDLLLAARICLHLSQRLACIMERSVVVIWFLWGQKWIVAFRRGTFLFVLIIILKVLSTVTDVEPMLGRRRRATSTQRRNDVGSTSHGRYRPNTCSLVVFFSLHNLPELLCAEIVPMLEAAINSGLVFGMVTDLLYTNMKTWFILTHWGPDKMIAIFQTTFSNAFSWMQIYEFRLNLTEVCLQGSNWQYIPALVQINGLAPASNKPLSFCTLCLDQSVHLRNRTVTSLDMWILHWRRSHWCLKSLVTQLDCLFNRWPIGDRWVPLTKSQ